MGQSASTPTTATARPAGRATGLVLGLVISAGVLLWAYWPTLGDLVERWSRDPQYTHGYLIPFFSIAILWLRREDLKAEKLQWSWWGAVVLAGAVALRSVGAYFSVPWLDAISLLPCLAGVVLLLGGWHLLRWSWVAIGFLIFTIPLPYFLEVSLSQPLRQVATVWSTYCLQFAGVPALAKGSTIAIGRFHLEVAEACSGLSMLMTFFALTTAFVCLVEPPLWKRVVLLISAVPIAVVANVARITATGILHEMVGDHASSKVFHDWAGVFMMPVALLLLLVELWFLAHLFTPVPLSERGPGATMMGSLRGQPNRFPT